MIQKQLLIDILDLDPAIHQKAREKALADFDTYFDQLKEIFTNEADKDLPDELIISRLLDIFSRGGIDEDIYAYLCRWIEEVGMHKSEDPDPILLTRVVSALALWEDKEVLKVVAPLLKHNDSRIVANVIEMYSGLGNSEEHCDLILPFLEHSHHRVKTAALIALWGFGVYGVADVANEMLQNPSAVVQRSAHFALGKMASIDAENGSNPFGRFLKSFFGFSAKGSNTRASHDKESVDRETVFSLGLFVSQRFMK